MELGASQARIDCSPCCAAIARKKYAAGLRPGKQIRAAYSKGKNVLVRGAGTGHSPASAIIGREIHAAAVCPRNELRVAQRKAIDSRVLCQAGDRGRPVYAQSGRV